MGPFSGLLLSKHSLKSPLIKIHQREINVSCQPPRPTTMLFTCYSFSPFHLNVLHFITLFWSVKKTLIVCASFLPLLFLCPVQVQVIVSVCTCRCMLLAMCRLYRLWPVLVLLNGLSNWIPVAKSQEALRREDVGTLVSDLFRIVKCPEKQQLCEKV